MRGGKLVVVTPNVADLWTMTEAFWLDLTHIRPYPLPLLRGHVLRQASSRLSGAPMVLVGGQWVEGGPFNTFGGNPYGDENMAGLMRGWLGWSSRFTRRFADLRRVRRQEPR